MHGLFLGGSLEQASLSIAVNQAQAEDFKFFHRQLTFEAGEFERLFCEGASTPQPPTLLCMLGFGHVLCKRALGVWQVAGVCGVFSELTLHSTDDPAAYHALC